MTGKIVTQVVGVSAGAATNGLQQGKATSEVMADVKNAAIAGAIAGLADAAFTARIAPDNLGQFGDTVVAATASSISEAVASHLDFVREVVGIDEQDVATEQEESEDRPPCENKASTGCE